MDRACQEVVPHPADESVVAVGVIVPEEILGQAVVLVVLGVLVWGVLAV